MNTYFLAKMPGGKVISGFVLEASSITTRAVSLSAVKGNTVVRSVRKSPLGVEQSEDSIARYTGVFAPMIENIQNIENVGNS